MRREIILGCGACGLILNAAAFADGPAFSGITATANSAETASSNPAGMSRLDAPQWAVKAIVAAGFGDFEVDEAQTTTSGGNPRNDVSPVIVPAVFYVHPLGERWRAGVSLTVPSGFGSSYGDNWAGRYYTDDYSLVYVALSPALSYRVNDHLSLGAALNINYTESSSEVAVNALVPNRPDGRAKAKLDGIGSSFTGSVLWEFDAHTRVGATYTTEASADLDGNVRFHNVGPVLGAILDATGLLNANVEVENILPARAMAGVYHDMDSGRYFTLDALWVDFSKFATGSVSLEGVNLDFDSGGGFQDFYGVTAGYGWPDGTGRTYAVGAFYITPPVRNAERTLALALDRMWGVGGGIKLNDVFGHRLDVYLNVVNYGDAPVDTGPSIVRGRVVGKTESPYAMALAVTWII